MRCVFIAALLAAGSPAPLLAHSGGLNGEGCHNNRRTGDYHCHRAGAPLRSSPSARPSGGGAANGPFANCGAARAAGATPVLAGSPGYSRKLDRDGDGIGCE